MLRFNPVFLFLKSIYNVFQYILCYGSTYNNSGFSIRYIISIHPMLRFNVKFAFTIFLPPLFQYILCYGSTPLYPRVSWAKQVFQYILCYGSTKKMYKNTKRTGGISIHPMLRFNHYGSQYARSKNNISIHPMLRFNLL